MKIHEYAALRAAGVAIAEGPHLIGPALRDVLRRSKVRGREVARWSAAGAPVARRDGAPARRGRTKDDLVAARVGGAARTRRRRAGMTGDGERVGHTAAPDRGRASRKSS